MQNKTILIKDYPCGSGKTSSMINGLSPDKKYLIVVPLLSEVQRIIDHSDIDFHQPNGDEGTKQKTKYDSIEFLLLEGKNIVTTHQLYSAIVSLARDGLLSDYQIVIDEVPNVCDVIRNKNKRSLKEFYLGAGYIEVDEHGKVIATEKWDRDHVAVADTLDEKLYHFAKSGFLYLLEETLFIWVLPTELLTLCQSMTILTYKSKGSLLLPFLEKSGIKTVVHTDAALEEEFRLNAKKLITLQSISGLERFNFSYTGQTKLSGNKKAERRVGKKLGNFRERVIQNIELQNILITCSKNQWISGEGKKKRAAGFAIKSNLFRANWIPNTTRGTNDYAHCSHLVYLYDQYINPYVGRWLEVTSRQMSDAYALTELIQWVWRSRIRRGEPITLYIPSPRMRGLFEDWLNTPITSTHPAVSIAA